MTSVQPLSAPIELTFDYTRSLGPTLSRFMTGLRDRTVTGVRVSDGRVVVPPVEYDPVTGAAVSEFVRVADEGEIVSWSWAAEPLDGQPLARPFAWVLVRLDGADTTMLHALDVPSPDAVRTGQRVRARWADEPGGSIRDIVCFEPADTPQRPPAAKAPTVADVVSMVTTPIELSVEHTASPQEMTYLRGLEQGRIIAQRCPVCRKVYVPPRGACPVDGVPTDEDVELPDKGIVTTFCIVNVPFPGQKIPPPYVAAYVLLDGADIAFLHLVFDTKAEDVRMGMRVEAKWRPREEWGPTLQNIEYFRPTGEPDADYDSFKEHL